MSFGSYAKRIVLFILTNLAVVLLIGVLSHLFGVDRSFTRYGLDLRALLGFSAIVGFTGAFVSLLLSKTMAKLGTGARVIERPSNETEAWLVTTVERLARQAGIGMPEVAIYEGDEMNAFATGAFRNSALVAVSTGLLRAMRRDEVEAVLGHEISHVANGDMVTMTLLQGVLNTFVYFLSRVIAYAVDRGGRDDNRGGRGATYFIVSMVSQVVLGILASMILMWFSRHREFRADAGSAQLGGAGPMINALRRLQHQEAGAELPASVNAFGITGGEHGGFMRFFRSHPPLEERIAALQSFQRS